MQNLFPILVVEDDPVSRKLLQRILELAGYTVVAVEDGLEAIKAFQTKFFPIVITDWMMPNMDGIELCRRIRKEITGEGYVYIFFLTSKTSRQDIILGLEAGADDYLIKPYDRSELMARIKTATRILDLEKSLKEAYVKIQILSVTDKLTGCYNRTYLDEHLPRELKRSARYGSNLSIILCDIDRFKVVNDQYGHQAGDQVLQHFARRMQRTIRTGIDWVTRYGGEEFLVVLPETHLDQARSLAERLRMETESQPVSTDWGQIYITASYGVASVPSDTPEKDHFHERLIARADAALYRAKDMGRNRVANDPS